MSGIETADKGTDTPKRDLERLGEDFQTPKETPGNRGGNEEGWTSKQWGEGVKEPEGAEGFDLDQTLTYEVRKELEGPVDEEEREQLDKEKEKGEKKGKGKKKKKKVEEGFLH